MNKRDGFRWSPLPVVVGTLLTMALLAGCGSSNTDTSIRATTTGTVTTSLSDPPTCKGPLAPSNMQFSNVWVTITRVRAHISSSAGENGSGWVDLVDLRDNPMQIDLLSGSDTECILAVLGSTESLPPGNYQQIRLHLLSNTPGAGEATPASNACASTGGFNCVQPVSGPLQIIQLSSQAQTGLKVPPGRIAGGAISLEAGEAADINIEFSACNSIVRQGNGSFRLLPTLHAGEVSLGRDIISGRLVVDATTDPLPGDSTIVVLAEQPDAEDIDRVIMEGLADSSAGTFSFCPLPTGNYDIVAAGIDGNGVTYNATITFEVPTGTNLGDIPLVPEPGPDTSPATLAGVVTTQNSGAPVDAHIAMSALQSATPDGGSARLVTIPTFGASTSSLATEADGCPDPTTSCANYTLNVPASNPQVGTFNSAGFTYTAPAAGDIFYSVNALAFVAGSEGTANCSPSSLTTSKLEDGVTDLTVTAGATSTAETLAFTGCTAPSP